MNALRMLSALVFVVASGCASDRHDVQGCTDVGCVDGVSISFGALADRFPTTPLSVHVCIDAACQDAVISAGSCEQAKIPDGTTPSLVLLCFPSDPTRVTLDASVVGGLAGRSSVTVAVSITDAGQKVVYEHTEAVSLVTSRPNGATCEPVCNEGTLTLTP